MSEFVCCVHRCLSFAHTEKSLFMFITVREYKNLLISSSDKNHLNQGINKKSQSSSIYNFEKISHFQLYYRVRINDKGQLLKE